MTFEQFDEYIDAIHFSYPELLEGIVRIDEIEDRTLLFHALGRAHGTHIKNADLPQYEGQWILMVNGGGYGALFGKLLNVIDTSRQITELRDGTQRYDFELDGPSAHTYTSTYPLAVWYSKDDAFYVVNCGS